MKATDITIESLKNFGDEDEQDEYEELAYLPTRDISTVKLTLPDGTKLVITTSEWATVYIKEPTQESAQEPS